MGCNKEEEMTMTKEMHEGCATPTREECRIPVVPPYPPPLKRKKRFTVRKKVEPPKNGYFQPPVDLEILFSLIRRKTTSF